MGNNICYNVLQFGERVQAVGHLEFACSHKRYNIICFLCMGIGRWTLGMYKFSYQSFLLLVVWCLIAFLVGITISEVGHLRLMFSIVLVGLPWCL